MTFFECWKSAAGALFSQALAGEPKMAEASPEPIEGLAPAFLAELGGDLEGRFTVVLDPGLLDSALMGEGLDQKAAWGELLKEAADAAAADLLPRAGVRCRVIRFEETTAPGTVTQAFALRAGTQSWRIGVLDAVRSVKPAEAPMEPPKPGEVAPAARGLELLLDVELEATIRFGCRELPLKEILELGPGDVVTLDRHISDPADLIVGDKIVARGEVVLVNGNFGLRVTEVAAPRKRLESIRCLF